MSYVKKPAFDYFILTLIIISSVLLALDNPLNDPDGILTMFLFYSDIFFTLIFAIEALMKIVAFGFVANGKNSYLRNAWNAIDFGIVLLSLVSMFITNNKLKIVKILRLLRVLRPLRVISRN